LDTRIADERKGCRKFASAECARYFGQEALEHTSVDFVTPL